MERDEGAVREEQLGRPVVRVGPVVEVPLAAEVALAERALLAPPDVPLVRTASLGDILRLEVLRVEENGVSVLGLAPVEGEDAPRLRAPVGGQVRVAALIPNPPEEPGVDDDLLRRGKGGRSSRRRRPCTGRPLERGRRRGRSGPLKS